MPTSAASPASPPVGTPVLSSTPRLCSSPSQAPFSTPAHRRALWAPHSHNPL
ncbi:hypothetical protein CIB84_015202, partial [Bambusicola thoracicus]